MILASGPFIASFLPYIIGTPLGYIVGIPLGCLFIGLTYFHAYFLKVAKEKKLNEVYYLEKRLGDYSWLMYAIRRLIYRKSEVFSKASNSSNDPIEFGTGSIWKILEMLYRFYIYYAAKPVKLSIIFFVPSKDRKFLSCKFYHYDDNQKPHFYGNEEVERRLFNMETSPYLAVKACKSRKTEILESEQEIQYMYEGQNRRIK